MNPASWKRWQAAAAKKRPLRRRNNRRAGGGAARSRSREPGRGWIRCTAGHVRVVDAQGRVVPTANLLVKFELSGPGAIIGLNNGDPTNHEPEKGDQHSVFHGLAQVIVQSGSGQGKLMLHAMAEGLTRGDVAMDIRPVPTPAAVPIPNR